MPLPYSNIHPRLALGADTLLCPGFVQQRLLRKFVPWKERNNIIKSNGKFIFLERTLLSQLPTAM